MNWRNKKVLVTGAGGFIGSHLTEKLISSGANVRALLHYNSRNDLGLLELIPENAKRKIDIFAGDVQDLSTVRNAIKGVDAVFHLAALIGIPYSYIAPESYVNTNVIGTLNIMQACMDEGVKKVIHTSTSEVYGTAKYFPMDENHPLVSQSPYAATKIGADKIAESFYLSFGLPVVTVRPFNTYGPRQSARAVIPTIITQMLTGKKVALGSLSPMRDFTYVSDTVEGFIRIAEAPDSVFGQTINIGSNFEISIWDLARKIVSLSGKKVKIIKDPLRIRPVGSEVDRLICDNKKAKQLTGWSPTVKLDDGLKKTMNWISGHIGLYKPQYYNR